MLASIRNAGGLRKLSGKKKKRKQSKKAKAKAAKGGGGMDMMSVLKARLVARQKVLSGKKEDAPKPKVKKGAGGRRKTFNFGSKKKAAAPKPAEDESPFGGGGAMADIVKMAMDRKQQAATEDNDWSDDSDSDGFH